jgi:anti-sigma regulatory factor (Ser/Thr protein kinase)
MDGGARAIRTALLVSAAAAGKQVASLQRRTRYEVITERVTFPEKDVAVESPAGDYLRILSRPDWVEPVVLFLKDRAMSAGACDDASATRLVVSMTEAITNAVVHGNYGLSSELKEHADAFERALGERAADPAYVGRVVDIRASYLPDRSVWTVTDQGCGFDVGRQLAKLESDDPEAILSSGRGITIMKAFMDDVAWSDEGRQVRLTAFRGPAAERRGAPRRKYVAPIAYQIEDGPVRQATARDLSSSGIACVASETVPVGTAVLVTLDPTTSGGCTVPGTVVRCGAVSGPFHDVAVRFGSELEAAAPNSAEK